MCLFEAGPVYLYKDAKTLPEEPTRLALVMCGKKEDPAFDRKADETYDFFDLKGAVEQLFAGAHIPVVYEVGGCPRLPPRQVCCGEVGRQTDRPFR